MILNIFIETGTMCFYCDDHGLVLGFRGSASIYKIFSFQTLPLAITALIPMVAFPFFEIMKSEDVAAAYLPVLNFYTKQVFLRTLRFCSSEVLWLQ